MVPLGRKTLFEDLPRFLVAQAGVAFAVGLIAIETGIYFGFLKSAVLSIQESHADVWVAARETPYFELAFPIRYDALDKVRSVTGVARAEALLIKTSVWRGPIHKLEYIRVFGFDPRGELWSPGVVPAQTLAQLVAPDTAMVDAAKVDALNVDGVGGTGKIGQHDVRIVGLVHGTQPIISATFIYTSLRNATAYLAPPTPSPQALAARMRAVMPPSPDPVLLERYVAVGLIPMPKPAATATPKPAPTPTADPGTLAPADDISYVLVRAGPGVDLEALKGRLTSAVPDTRAYTQAEMAQQTDSYWVGRTGIGFILGLIAVVGLVVGVTVAGQILYTSVVEHIKEYGTLRAMGAPDSLFYAVVAEQALLMALLGFVPGIALSLIIAAWSQAHKGILILITPTSALLTLAVIAAMCVASGIFAVQRALRVDPAIVFKA
jgi:putative ABC transport system permease protein